MLHSPVLGTACAQIADDRDQGDRGGFRRCFHIYAPEVDSSVDAAPGAARSLEFVNQRDRRAHRRGMLAVDHAWLTAPFTRRPQPNPADGVQFKDCVERGDFAVAASSIRGHWLGKPPCARLATYQSGWRDRRAGRGGLLRRMPAQRCPLSEAKTAAGAGRSPAGMNHRCRGLATGLLKLARRRSLALATPFFGRNQLWR